MTLNRFSPRTLYISLIVLFLLIFPLTAWGADSSDTDRPLSARERFYQKYRDRVAADSKSPTDRVQKMEDRKNAIEQRREEINKQRSERKLLRRDRIKAETDRMQGKAPAVEKKEKERLDARRKAMQDRARARRDKLKAQRKERHQDVMQKAREHDANPDAGFKGQGGDTASGLPGSPAMEERRRQIEERRQAILERSRARRDGRASSRRTSPDAMTGAHISGSDARQPEPRSHISGAPTPGTDHQAPDPHISGN